MQLPAHLHQSRHGVFYFRFVLPSHLRPFFGGQREIKRSLATRDPKVAKIWAYSLFADIQTALGATRKAMGRSDSDVTERDGNLNLDGVADVRRFKVDVAQGIYEADPNVPGDAQQMQAFIQFLHQTNPDLLKVRPAAAQVDPEAAAKAIKGAAQKAFERLPQTGGPTTSVKLSKAIEAWEQDFAKDNTNTKTQSSYFSVLQRFLGVTGDVVVKTVTAEHIRTYRQKRKDQGRKTATVDGDTKAIGRFFDWARREGHYPSIDLPTVNLYELSRRKRDKQAEGAERYTLDELRRVFAPETYAVLNHRPHEYWLPLLALFTGARIEELTQLHLSDVYQLNDIPIFDLNDLGAKALKTEAAKRKVPIHPVLIELGLLDYLADVKVAFPNAEQLFPYLSHTKHGRLSDRASKAWGRYLDKLNITGRDKVFHSFRDTVNNELADRGVPLELRCALVGHDINHVNVTKYRDPIPTPRLMDEGIGRIRYERKEANGSLTTLNLAPLKYHKGQFVQRLQECEREENKRKTSRAHKATAAEIEQAREEKQKRRPGRPPKAKSADTINSGEDAKAKAERLQALEARALRNQQRRALKKQLANQGKPNA